MRKNQYNSVYSMYKEYNMSKTKKYVRISEYGDILMPIEKFQSVCDSMYLVRSTYTDGKDELTDIKQIEAIKLHSVEEVEVLLMHDMLSNGAAV